ncbi:hypothetical protein EXIGLDRAFT_604997 [Exidia glandulosa HHB12029]|uniref:CxC2-like cysteine cluster KDZ transposase-associated domain-containing protein n=1 Tax=Exidia glandulosa HHB12029 TaxID=1314781 RepID=A0A166BD45_EXIGL|nr:hypothetical protein EXIGLDRAFT_604997 [Exidia glandulosa HHB12029]
MLSLEYDPNVGQLCQCDPSEPCGGRELRYWRCLDCFLSATSCASRMVQDHALSPFHRVQKWNGAYFDRASLCDAGLSLHLGHEGTRCPRVSAEEAGTVFTIGDLTGVHKIAVVSCSCFGSGDLVQQLVRSRLMPATMKYPRTAFTFALLQDWELDTVQGKKPLYDYWTKLVRLTRNVDVNADKVSRHDDVHAVKLIPMQKMFESFSTATRFFRAATRKRQSGQALDIDSQLLTKYPNLTYAGSMLLVCPACPHPGFNMEPGWEKLVDDPRRRHVITEVLAKDGNFKAYEKDKPYDPNDRSLCDGAGAFAPEAEMKALLDRVTDAPEVCKGCASAEKMHEATRVKGARISGVLAVICARHVFYRPRGMNDLKKGEKYVHLPLNANTTELLKGTRSSMMPGCTAWGLSLTRCCHESTFSTATATTRRTWRTA